MTCTEQWWTRWARAGAKPFLLSSEELLRITRRLSSLKATQPSPFQVCAWTWTLAPVAASTTCSLPSAPRKASRRPSGDSRGIGIVADNAILALNGAVFADAAPGCHPANCLSSADLPTSHMLRLQSL